MLLDLLEPAQHLAHLFRGVRHRVQTDHRIPCAKGQALQGGGGDALRVVGGVVGLQTAAQGSRQADGGVAMGGNGDFLGRVDQVQIAHQLAHRRDHLRCQPPAQLPDVISRGSFRQDPLPQVRYGPVSDFVIDSLIHIILDDPGHFILFIGNRRTLPQVPQGHSGQHHLGCDPLLSAFRRQARQLIAGFFLVGLSQHLFQIVKCVGFPQKGGFQIHFIIPCNGSNCSLSGRPDGQCVTNCTGHRTSFGSLDRDCGANCSLSSQSLPLGEGGPPNGGSDEG